MTDHAATAADVWVFGYGSLIWRPGFEFLERRRARLRGWQRRFWQGSHDHRGLPHRPGRVVTLAETGQGHCDGVAYRLDARTMQRTFETLDHREKNGYERRDVEVELGGAVALAAATEASNGSERDPTWRAARAVVYLAATQNHAYLGPAPIADIVQQIAASAGPSGTNADYLIELAGSLRRLGIHDPHVFELEAALAAQRS